MDEYAISWIKGLDYAEVTFPARSKEKSLMLKMADEGVEGVKITAVNRDGSVVGHVPLACVLFRRPPVKVELTQDEKERRAALMSHVNEARKTARNAVDDNLPAEAPKGEI